MLITWQTFSTISSFRLRKSNRTPNTLVCAAPEACCRACCLVLLCASMTHNSHQVVPLSDTLQALQNHGDRQKVVGKVAVQCMQAHHSRSVHLQRGATLAPLRESQAGPAAPCSVSMHALTCRSRLPLLAAEPLASPGCTCGVSAHPDCHSHSSEQTHFAVSAHPDCHSHSSEQTHLTACVNGTAAPAFQGPTKLCKPDWQWLRATSQADTR
jgi:hypothetical protein